MLKIFDKSKGNLQPISDFMADEQLKETKGKKKKYDPVFDLCLHRRSL